MVSVSWPLLLRQGLTVPYSALLCAAFYRSTPVATGAQRAQPTYTFVSDKGEPVAHG